MEATGDSGKEAHSANNHKSEGRESLGLLGLRHVKTSGESDQSVKFGSERLFG